MDQPKDKRDRETLQDQIQIPETSFNILYIDVAFATASPTGFVLDFGQKTPQLRITRIVSRIGMSPMHFKMFAKMLEGQLREFEARFGEIKISPEAQSEMDKVTEELKKKRNES